MQGLANKMMVLYGGVFHSALERHHDQPHQMDLSLRAAPPVRQISRLNALSCMEES